MIKFNKLNILITLFAILLLRLPAQGQELTPVVLNFGKSDYHQEGQNWSVSCCGKGTMYFGNGGGLLSYDGIRWNLIPLPGHKVARSVLCEEGRIYVGSFEELGYFEEMKDGTMAYTSLSSRLVEYEMNNDEIWTILKVGDDILFHSFMSVFVYSPGDDNIRGIKAGEFIESIGVTPWGEVLTSHAGLSAMDIETGEVNLLPDIPFKGRMVTVLPYDGHKALIVTLADGLWLYDGKVVAAFPTDADDLLASCSLNRACVDADGNFVLGSVLEGCICISKDGRALWHIDASNILQDNTVLGLGQDGEGNVWIAMDSGIAMVSGNSGIRYVSNLSPSVGAVYSIFNKGPHMYIGSNKGLYIAEFDEEKGRISGIRQIPEVKGNVWYIEDYGGQTICGANDGTYEIENGNVRKFPASNAGGSCMAGGRIHGREVLIQGTYTELCVYRRESGRWVFSHPVEGFVQPVGSISIDYMGNIWAAHNQRGMFRINLTEDLRRVASMEYHPSLGGDEDEERINVSNIMGRTVFSDRSAFYTFDDMKGEIIPYSTLNSGLGRFSKATTTCRYEGDTYWFITTEEATLASFIRTDSIVIREIIPYSMFNNRMVDQKNEIRRLPDGSSIMTLNNSLAFIPAPADSMKRDFSASKLRITGISLSDSKKERHEMADLTQASFSFPYDYRLITVDYSCPLFSTRHDTYFRYMLEGRDKVWTDIGESTSLDLSYLQEGRYVLCLEAVTGGGEPIDALEVPIRIRAPYYRSTAAYIFYVLAILSFLGLIALTVIRRMQDQRREIEKQKLENELTAKSKEITVSTMNLIRKNELLRQVKEDLTEQKKELGSAWPDRSYRKIINSIDSYLSSDEDWEVFEKNFDLIHTDFFHTLKTRYPELTASDLRFCSYLCLNLSSKEIASMMNISLKGVEAARYRIRKKIRLPSNESLTTFLMGIH